MTEKIGFMKRTTFEKIFESGVPDSIKLNWRGEPLLHENVVDFASYAKLRGVLDVSLNTNGFFLSEDKAIALAEAGVSWIILSIDGATKQTYENIRTNSNFETVVQNAYTCSEVLTFYPKTKLRIQMCLQPDNQHEIELWKAKFSTIADKLRIGKLYDPQGKRGYNIRIPKSCTSLWQRLTVGWDGTIHPCPADYYSEGLGNIRSLSIRKAWHLDKMQYYRNTLKMCGRVSPLCSKCSSYC